MCLCAWKRESKGCLRTHIAVEHTTATEIPDFCVSKSCTGLFLTVGELNCARHSANTEKLPLPLEPSALNLGNDSTGKRCIDNMLWTGQ